MCYCDDEKFEVGCLSYLGYTAVSVKESKAMTPPTAALARLRLLHAAAEKLTDGPLDLLICPEAVRGFEQALTEAMFDCISPAYSRRKPKAH